MQSGQPNPVYLPPQCSDANRAHTASCGCDLSPGGLLKNICSLSLEQDCLNSHQKAKLWLNIFWGKCHNVDQIKICEIIFMCFGLHTRDQSHFFKVKSLCWHTPCKHNEMQPNSVSLYESFYGNKVISSSFKGETGFFQSIMNRNVLEQNPVCS